MTLHFDLLAKKLVPYYSYFRVAHRLLFANHSHQAWPNACLEGQKEAFYLSANKINAKWEDILQKQEILRNYLRTWYEDSKGGYSFSANTHDLLVRLLSALPFEKKTQNYHYRWGILYHCATTFCTGATNTHRSCLHCAYPFGNAGTTHRKGAGRASGLYFVLSRLF